MEHNGSGIVAMCGKNCVGIASDTRLGAGPQTVSCEFKKVFKVHDKLYYGLAGLGTDVQTMSEKLEFRMNMYELRENRKIKPSTFGNVLCNMLYSKRFGPYFAEPVVAGLEGKENKPFITAMDLIGAPVFTDDFWSRERAVIIFTEHVNLCIKLIWIPRHFSRHCLKPYLQLLIVMLSVVGVRLSQSSHPQKHLPRLGCLNGLTQLIKIDNLRIENTTVIDGGG